MGLKVGFFLIAIIALIYGVSIIIKTKKTEQTTLENDLPEKFAEDKDLEWCRNRYGIIDTVGIKDNTECNHLGEGETACIKFIMGGLKAGFFLMAIIGLIYGVYLIYTKNPIAIAIKTKKTGQKKRTEIETRQIRNIVIVGGTGSGKSTLANVLSGGEKFAEVTGWTSGTKRIENKDFVWYGSHYRVIDTVGIKDNTEDNTKLLCEVMEIFNHLEEGENAQVFYVIKDRLTKWQVETLKLFRRNLTSHITIICSNFPDFENKEKCEKNIERLHTENENKSIVEVIKNCKIIHIDNPPLHYRDVAIQRRKASRKLLLDHLEFICNSVLNLSYSIESIDAEKIFEEIAKNNQT